MVTDNRDYSDDGAHGMFLLLVVDGTRTVVSTLLVQYLDLAQ